MTLLRVALLLLLLATFSGCAVNSTPLDPYDPYERTNREIFELNQKFDQYVLAPVASGYAAVTPRAVRRGVDNFFNNARYPNVILNDLLQGKVTYAFQDTGRFLLNTTVGVLGLWDPAEKLGLPAREEDFGQTLAVWGVNSGPYLELPAQGPSYTRHLADYPVAAATNMLTYAFDYQVTGPLLVLYYINKRALLEKAVKIREEAAIDPYLFTRSAYMQSRHNLIHDGNPPTDDLYDESLFEDEPTAPDVTPDD
jgi:phospholipid-binding lipoprotein MlaA